jgi:muramoyltetrapeptide carboxypeptidase LdcA involved in peptidoglycan recycling
MRYPKPLRPGSTIGVTAPSSGVAEPSHVARLELVLAQMRVRGFGIVEGRCLRAQHKHVSAPAAARARDLEGLWADPSVRAIIPPWGGELLIDMLHELDFERLGATDDPKWLLGYSDTSTLLFALTLATDIATAHGPNLLELIDNQPDGLTQACLRHLQAAPGERFEQASFARHQKSWISWESQVDVPFALTEPSRWSSLHGRGSERFSGRLIGGCIDTIRHLVGTPYGRLPEFVVRHRDDGVVLYLENCEQSPVSVARSLWQMRHAQWFQAIRGLVFGRSSGPERMGDAELDQHEAIASVVGDLGIPVIVDADVGHKPPQLLLLNGALASFALDDGRATVVQQLA